MNNKNMLFLTALMAAALATPASALSCGDTVNGTVTLSEDIVCNSMTSPSPAGLIVTASNTIINLNGHTISCVGNGFGGSCQHFNDGVGKPGFVGIWSYQHGGVTVNGPGTISGFNYGVWIDGQRYHSVNGVTVSGPPTPQFAANNRGNVIGILITGSPCDSVLLLKPSPVFAVTQNQVSNQTTGILVSGGGCGQVANNILANNAGIPSGDILSNWIGGIDVSQMINTTVNGNALTQNGVNSKNSGGVRVTGSSTSHVLSNYSSSNCGNGVEADDSSQINVQNNIARYNGLGTANGQCLAVLSSSFHDLAQFGAGANNWNANNTCHTQTANIPAGVCNASE